MVPGLTREAEARLLGVLDARVTSQTADTLARCDFTMLAADEPAALDLGVTCKQSGLTLVVTDPTRRLGRIDVQTGGQEGLLFFDNRTWGGNMYASLRMLGSGTVVFFNDIGDGFVMLHDVFLRAHDQFLYWGIGSTAVGLSIELEGAGRGVVVGDDALISSGVWLRNHDMHAVHDLRTGVRVNPPPCDTVIERHVWLGQDALLLNCRRVGAGAIVGARAFVKDPVAACSAVGGLPARVLRRAVSWGRNQAEGISAAELASLAGLYDS